MKHNQRGFSVLWLGLLVFVIALAGIVGWRVYEAQSSTTINGNSVEATLTGIVTEGPTAPVCIEGESCESAVRNHTIEALDTSGNITATGKTDENGRYVLQLKPGRYTLVLLPQIGLSRAAGNQVDVKAGSNTRNLSVDTGIR